MTAHAIRAATLLAVTVCLLVPAPALAQSGTISTIAGGGPNTIPGVAGAVSNAASTGEIGQMAWDGTRQLLYFTSTTFHRVYVYDPSARQATPLAGNGFDGFGGDGGAAAQASFSGPIGLALDPTNANVLYVADTGSNRVRRVNLSTRVVDTVLGSGVCNSGELTTTAVAASSANVCAPGQLAVDGNGVLYVFDLGKSAVWRLSSGQAAMIAGNGTALTAAPTSGGTATGMSLGSFSGIAVDPAGQFLYLDEFFGLRRLALTTGLLSAPLDLGATSVPLQHGSPIAVESATGRVIYAIFPASSSTESLFAYTPSTGTKTQIAGQGSTVPPYLTPTVDVNLGSGANGVGELVAIAPATGASAAFVASRSGWIHSMSSLASAPSFLTILGNGARSYCGDGGPAINACLDTPTSVSVAADGTIYVVDAGNGVVRFVDHAGIIHSLVSPKSAGIVPSAIVAPAVGTAFLDPGGVPMSANTLLFTSVHAHQVFALDPVTDTTLLYSGTGQPACTTLADGSVFCDNNADAGLGAAKYGEPVSIAADSFGNPYVVDTDTNVVLCLQCTDSIVGVAGGDIFNTSGHPAQWTTLNGPVGVAVDSDNGLLIAEQAGQTVRRVNPDPRHGYVYPFEPRSEIIVDVMTPASAGAGFAPVGVAIVPGKVLASDAATNRVISAVHPGGACAAGSGALQSGVFAGGGTTLQDNVPAAQAQLVGIGQIASSFANGTSVVYIVDRGSNRIRAVSAGVNHPPVANAGADRSVAMGPFGFAQVTLDGSASTDPDCDVLTYTWTSPDLPAPLVGETVQVNLSGVGTTHTFTLTVDDGFGGTSTATVSLTVAALDLGISGTASAGRINPGETVTYNAVVTNVSSVDATGVGVTLLPATTEFVSATASQGTCDGPAYGTSGYVQCVLGDLAAGAHANVSIVLRPAVEEILNNSLTVFADQGDSNPANDTLAITTQVGGSTTGGGGTSGGGTGGGGGSTGGACSCGLTGTYVNPAAAVDVDGDPLTSPGNKFQVSAIVDNANNLDTLTITRTSDNAVLLAGTAFPITVHWGFSPDGNRIAIHAVAIGTQEDEIWVYDLSVKPARQIVHYRLPVVSDRLQFSPSGYYFVLAAVVLQGRAEIDIYRVAGVSTEDRVYQTTFSFQAIPGVDEEEFEAAHRGFSPDQPETSFVYAFNTSQNQVSLNLANLTSPHTVPVFSQNISAGSAFWQFNPCGNLLGVVSQPFTDKVDVGLFKTSDGTRVGTDSQFPFRASDSVVLKTETTGEFAIVGSTESLLATDPSCNANTQTGLDVNVAATDPTTGTTAVSLTFSLVTQAGQTAVTSSSGGNPPPDGFRVGDPPIYYDVTTTAVYSGQITVCISYNGVTFSGSPKIFHYVNGTWVDSTTSIDTANKTVCGVVTSLSPFALFEPIPDTTPPSISCASPDALWHAADVAVACTSSDAGSGLANPADASFTLSTNVPAGTETSSAQTGTRTVCDRAGNCATAGPVGPIRIDKKAPTVNLSAPANGGAYLLNQTVPASFSCSDGGSGIATCSGTVPNGAAVPTASIGSSTFTVTATDNAGNTATGSVGYSVGYSVCLLYDPTKARKSGSAYPIQIALCDASGRNVSSSSIVVHAIGVTQVSTNAPGTLADTGNSNPDFDFRYDATLGGYIFNLKTTGFTTGTYALSFTAGADPTVHSAVFQIK